MDNLDRELPDEHLCKDYYKFRPQAHEMLLKDYSIFSSASHCVGLSETIRVNHVQIQRIQRGGGAGDQDPPLKSQNIGFLSNIGPDPL